MKQVDPQPHWPEDIKKGRVRDPLTAFLNAPAIARVRQDRELLSDREYCELVVAFANDGALPMESWLRPPASPMPSAWERNVITPWH